MTMHCLTSKWRHRMSFHCCFLRQLLMSPREAGNYWPRRALHWAAMPTFSRAPLALRRAALRSLNGQTGTGPDRGPGPGLGPEVVRCRPVAGGCNRCHIYEWVPHAGCCCSLQTHMHPVALVWPCRGQGHPVWPSFSKGHLCGGVERGPGPWQWRVAARKLHAA